MVNEIKISWLNYLKQIPPYPVFSESKRRRIVLSLGPPYRKFILGKEIEIG